MLMETQVISKQRVLQHAEVFTGAREVAAMLDLVKDETERIESRFLEPACGNGNFLAAVLERKLGVVEMRYRKSQLEFERNAVLAVSSIYGLDIQQDNVVACRQRLLATFTIRYKRLFKTRTKPECLETVIYILERNIIYGDSLTLKTVGANSGPIIFSEWAFPFHNSLMKRRDFSFYDLFRAKQADKGLFAEPVLYSDSGGMAFVPKVLRNYPPIHFLKIGEHRK